MNFKGCEVQKEEWGRASREGAKSLCFTLEVLLQSNNEFAKIQASTRSSSGTSLCIDKMKRTHFVGNIWFEFSTEFLTTKFVLAPVLSASIPLRL